MTRAPFPDPLETLVAAALRRAGIAFTTEAQRPPAARTLDFHLPDSGVFIEVKRFHTPRIADQMASQENVICVQGADAVKWFAELVERAGKPAALPEDGDEMRGTGSEDILRDSAPELFIS